MPMKKHFIEVYKNYKIYIVAGTQPVMFIAEKDDPSKGTTLTGDDLEQLKAQIDNLLDFALNFKINIYDGVLQSDIIQNPCTKIKSVNGTLNGFAIVVESDYDLDVVIEMVEQRPIRKSKKRKDKKSQLNLIRILYRSNTHEIQK